MSEPATGEPDARKRARPVREGADGKGPAMVPRQRPTSWAEPLNVKIYTLLVVVPPCSTRRASENFAHFLRPGDIVFR